VRAVRRQSRRSSRRDRVERGAPAADVAGDRDPRAAVQLSDERCAVVEQRRARSTSNASKRRTGALVD
jgi:hypothetical protein